MEGQTSHYRFRIRHYNISVLLLATLLFYYSRYVYTAYILLTYIHVLILYMPRDNNQLWKYVCGQLLSAHTIATQRDELDTKSIRSDQSTKTISIIASTAQVVKHS